MRNRILILGAGGQLGTELVARLASDPNTAELHAADLRQLELGVPTLELDVVDKRAVYDVVDRLRPTVIYHLAAILSAAGERNPALAWQVNLEGLMNVLDAAVQHNVGQVFWPSSIAVFGPHTPRVHTPQFCTMDPGTVYGITKLTGERLVAYYHQRFGLDVRSLRYPGLISWKTEPGGGTTDYAIHIFHEALKHNYYTCFLEAGTRLPMMYMEDAVNATLQLMAAPSQSLSIRDSYNLAAVSFTPEEIAAEIAQLHPGFRVDYAPDFRQRIAESWPESIDDSVARNDWGWQHRFGLADIVQIMYKELQAQLNPVNPVS